MAERAWISYVKSAFAKSPLASNVVFGFVLTALEKLVEVEFACPCDTKWNALFAAAFFVVPAFLVILLMISIQGFKKQKWPERLKYLLYSIAPAIVWLILMYFDGRYYVCYETNWSGRFVFVPDAAPKKWCKPTNSSSSSGDELQKSLQWYSQSQGIGMGFIMIITAFVGLYVIIRMVMCLRNTEVQNDECSPSLVEDHQEPGTSVPTVNEDTKDSRV